MKRLRKGPEEETDLKPHRVEGIGDLLGTERSPGVSKYNERYSRHTTSGDVNIEVETGTETGRLSK